MSSAFIGVSFLLLLISIAVYDLGGGTFDISILEIQKGVFEVNCVIDVYACAVLTTGRLKRA